MSKERARRREAREREAAAKAAAREAEAARRARRDARLAPFRRLRTSLTTGRQTGALAERKRMRIRIILALLFFAQIVVWVVRDDWAARLAAFVIALFVFPVALVFAL